MTGQEKIAEIILSMTYGDLRDVAKEISDIVSDRVGDGQDFETPDAWIFILHGWAEANASEEEV